MAPRCLLPGTCSGGRCASGDGPDDSRAVRSAWARAPTDCAVAALAPAGIAPLFMLVSYPRGHRVSGTSPCGLGAECLGSAGVPAGRATATSPWWALRWYRHDPAGVAPATRAPAGSATATSPGGLCAGDVSLQQAPLCCWLLVRGSCRHCPSAVAQVGIAPRLFCYGPRWAPCLRRGPWWAPRRRCMPLCASPCSRACLALRVAASYLSELSGAVQGRCRRRAWSCPARFRVSLFAISVPLTRRFA